MLTAVLALALAAAPPARTAPSAERLITADSIRAHVRFLASDLLEGRGPGTRGDALAQAYIAAQLETLGLQPAGPQGFFQPFDIVGVDGHADAIQLTRGRESLALRHPDEVIAVAGDDAAHTALDGAELVFVGFGIRAPEYAWDDFKGQDLRGKVLLILNSDPEDDPALFAGRTRLWYGRWDYKYEMAARVGAAGAIILHTTHSAGYPWQVVRSSWTGPQYSVPSTDRRVPLRGWVTEDACRRLLALAGRNLEDLVRSANRREFQPVSLGIGVRTAFDSRIERTRTANVLGVLPGSDPRLSSEVVLYTAHHDHLGMRTGAAPGEDAIYNGAEDNASGVALMLTVARAYAALPKAPRRSILFAAVAAEEQGLLGSEFLARHPPVPLGRIAVDINIDGANVFGRTRDVTVIGLGKTDLDATLAALARKQGRVL
ncbi:MAG TPA: M28 family peptidase, partial [Myxococcaceae bacterium]|nr:M28 family peptidase [Myxococcaceae bacterium]